MILQLNSVILATPLNQSSDAHHPIQNQSNPPMYANLGSGPTSAVRPQSSATDTIPPLARVTLDVSPKCKTILGEAFQTSPVALIVGDQMFWEYSAGILTPVKVIEVAPPGHFRRLPLYHIEIISNNIRHDDQHEKLWM